MTNNYDVLIIGSGTAGFMCALELDESLSVLVLAKKHIEKCSSFFAQGGVAYAKPNDIESHIKDTIKSADGLANEKSIEFMVNNSMLAVSNLDKYGVRWDLYKGKKYLTNEGGHSSSRIACIADHTGKSIHQVLSSVAQKRKNITIINNSIAIDLLIKNGICGGAYMLQENGLVQTILVKNVILATGGASKVYKYTTNPDTSTGDGIAMAYRAGAKICNMEFNQFHPTCLYHPHAKSFLISETLRGEGAKLSLPNGSEFMHKYDARAELASRDIVARAIDNEMKILGFNYVYLDISFKDSVWIKNRFPTIFNKCLKFNIDITKDKIPVVPAAHYTCGGVQTDLSGKTNIENLYAIGEVAHTGVHGANRLASNSLLECIVFATAAAQSIKKNTNDFLQFENWDAERVVASEEVVIVRHLWDEVRLIMWNYVGVVRSNARLNYAKQKLLQIQVEVNDYYKNYLISSDLIELRNLVLCAQIIIESSISRTESRGLYYNIDYPNKNNDIVNTTLSR